MTTTLLIVRHGQTAWNKVVRYRGIIDLPLNELGHRQAEAVGQLIARDYAPSAIYASPLQRAIQTAEPIARLCNLETQPHLALRDIDFGEFAGLSHDEAEVVASGVSPIVRNVDRYEECILRTRVPRCSRPYWSDVGPNMQTMTSAISPSAAVRVAWIKFSAASEEGRSDER